MFFILKVIKKDIDKTTREIKKPGGMIETRPRELRPFDMFPLASVTEKNHRSKETNPSMQGIIYTRFITSPKGPKIHLGFK
jgi:hypothetical protein